MRLVASHSPKKCKFLSKEYVTQNMQCTLSFACIFKFMSLYMHKKKKLEYEVHTNMTNMQKYAPSQGPTLLMVSKCLAAASGHGFDSDGCDA